MAYDSVDRLGGADTPRCFSLPSQHAKPSHISRRLCARSSRQNNIDMNCPQLLNPFDAFSAPFILRSSVMNIRGNCKTSGFAGNAGILPAFFKDLRAGRPRSQGFCNYLQYCYFLKEMPIKRRRDARAPMSASLFLTDNS